MAEYRVTWDIDIDADTPEAAAQQAEAYMATAGARTYWVTPWKPGEAQPEPRSGEYIDLDTIGKAGAKS